MSAMSSGIGRVRIACGVSLIDEILGGGWKPPRDWDPIPNRTDDRAPRFPPPGWRRNRMG
jgi:hypothetical protein